MVTKVRAQISMDDTIIDNPELEKILDERQEAKYAVAEYKKLDKEAKEKIRSNSTPPPFRVGRFLITQSTTPGHTVNFETNGAVRINIKIAGEE